MEMNTNAKLRIRLESFNHELLVSSCQKISKVLRSPHVDKDSREHFEVRIHKRILEIYYDSQVSILDLLAEVDLAPGVFYRICLS